METMTDHQKAAALAAGAAIHATTALFVSKHPHTTLSLELEYQEGLPPLPLIEALAKIGWTEDRFGQASPLNGRVTRNYTAGGSRSFGGWTPAEHKLHMKNARRVLRAYGFVGVKHHKLTLADML